MKIQFTPQRRDDELVISKAGDVLTLNGEAFDFSQISNGDTLPVGAIKSTWFAGPVMRVNKELILTLVLPLPANFSQAQAFPDPLLKVADGVVVLPQPLPKPAAVEVQS